MDAAIERTVKRAEGIDTISIEFFPNYVNEKFWFNKSEKSLVKECSEKHLRGTKGQTGNESGI